jgi:ribonuclease HI
MSFLQASNNEAEYEALLHGMKMAKACVATRLKIFSGLESRRPASDEPVRRHQ